MKEYKIGNLKPKNRIFLAPMLEPNDIAFRAMCQEAGAGLTYTGMTSPLTKQEIILDDKPALQIFCNSTRGIKEFFRKYEDKVSLFDFNLGCPSTHAKKMQVGSYLHSEIKKIEEILKEMRASTEKPISIKLRKSPQTLDIIKIAEKYCDAITIHARTNDQGYSGLPDEEFAQLIKNSTKLPIIYSGNVNENNYRVLLEKYDFLMVGREALGSPEIFAEMSGKRLASKLDMFEYIRLAKKYDIKFAQIKYQAMNFTKGKGNAKELREKLVYAKTIGEIEKIFS